MKNQSKSFNIILVLKPLVLLFVQLLFMIFQVGCTTVGLNLESGWRDQEITIDGKNSEWIGAMWYLEDENISVGFRNDDKFFYMCMIAEDPIIRSQVMGQGFTVWFDPEGGDKKTFGIKFPIGMQAMGVQGRMDPRRATEREQSEPDPERMERALGGLLKELEILGPGKDDRTRLKVEETKGINIVLELSGGMIVYELKIPLKHDEQNPYAVGAQAGDLIGIGLEIPKLDMSTVRKKMGGTGMPGGGRMGGRAGGMGMRGARGPQMPRGIKLWLAVKLTSGQSQ
jgi:hypothetical protein